MSVDREKGAQLVVWGHREEVVSWQLQVKLKAPGGFGWCFSELRDLETFLHVDLKRQQIIDFTIDHLCNREISPVRLFFCFSGKLKYLVLLDQILEYDSNVWVIWNSRKQKVGRAFSCNGVGSSLDLFMGEGIFIKDLKGIGGDQWGDKVAKNIELFW